MLTRQRGSTAARQRCDTDTPIALAALSQQRVLLELAAQSCCTTPSLAVQPVIALGLLSSTCTALRQAVLPVWQALCVRRWPSCAALAAVGPGAWRAFALMRFAADADAAGTPHRLQWCAAALVPLLTANVGARAVSAVMLDVRDDSGDVVFSAHMRNVALLRDDDDAAEEFADARLQLHATPGGVAQAEGGPLVLVTYDGTNSAEPDACVRIWEAEEDDDNSDGAVDSVADAGRPPPTCPLAVQLCLLSTSGAAAVICLDAAEVDDRIDDHFGDANVLYRRVAEGARGGEFAQRACDERRQALLLPAEDAAADVEDVAAAAPVPPIKQEAHEEEDGAPSEEEESDASLLVSDRVLRWACTRNGVDILLNIYSARDDAWPDDGQPAGTQQHMPAGVAAPPAPSDNAVGESSSGSDASAGEEAVHAAAEVMADEVARVRAALRRNEAERRVLQRKLADGSDLSDSEFKEPELEASPRREDSSQCDRTSDGSVCGSELAAQPPKAALRLAFASLSLGWLPAGAAGAEALRASREAHAHAHALPLDEIDDDADPSEAQEDAMDAAEAAHFWSRLNEALPWR